jgi:DHA1 family bicyclomycin/chloramphenicol resistance-like MFS transporter
MSGNFISGRLGNRVSAEFMVTAGCLIGVITVEVMTVSLLIWPNYPLALFLPGAFIGIAQGLAMPHAQAAAINAEPGLTGTASGVVMFLHFFSAATASLFLSTLYDGTFYPLIEIIFVLSILALASAVFANAAKRRQTARMSA